MQSQSSYTSSCLKPQTWHENSKKAFLINASGASTRPESPSIWLYAFASQSLRPPAKTQYNNPQGHIVGAVRMITPPIQDAQVIECVIRCSVPNYLYCDSHFQHKNPNNYICNCYISTLYSLNTAYTLDLFYRNVVQYLY